MIQFWKLSWYYHDNVRGNREYLMTLAQNYLVHMMKKQVCTITYMKRLFKNQCHSVLLYVGICSSTSIGGKAKKAASNSVLIWRSLFDDYTTIWYIMRSRPTMSGLERSYTADHCMYDKAAARPKRKAAAPSKPLSRRARIHRPLLTCLPPYGLGVATHRRTLAKTRQK